METRRAARPYVIHTLGVGILTLERLPPELGAADLELPSWPILRFPLMSMTVKGEYLRGNRKSRGVYCQLTLHPCPASRPVSQGTSLLPLSHPVPVPLPTFTSHQVSLTLDGIVAYAEFSQQTLVKLTNCLLRPGPQTGRERLLRSPRQGAAGRRAALSLSSDYSPFASRPQFPFQSPDGFNTLWKTTQES